MDKVSMYKSRRGRVFETEAEALADEKKEDIQEVINNCTYFGELIKDPETVANYIYEKLFSEDNTQQQ